MKDLFDESFNQVRGQVAPLAERMRPVGLDDFVGQKRLLGPGKALTRLISGDNLTSIILWGPPGSGKTTLARLIAGQTRSQFEEFSAVTASVNDVRRVLVEARDRLKLEKKRTILFVDEIHRFNKAQQDAFLPAVEDGTIVLIGATTENPAFEINAPLISRAKVYVLDLLSDDDIRLILNRAMKRAYPTHTIAPEALTHIVKTANGDGRTALNALELGAFMARNITLSTAEQAVQRKAIYFDKKGDNHYDTISALIKSIRGSDPNAALYWLARMVQAGEDPVFIARRLTILASEDIGNADPQALVVATAAMQAAHMIGMPEAQLILAQTVTYLSTAPKSNAAYEGLSRAKRAVDERRLEPVPLHLRNAPAELLRQLGAGRDYKYPHAFGGHVKQDYLPENLKGSVFYNPKSVGFEKKIQEFLETIREQTGEI